MASAERVRALERGRAAAEAIWDGLSLPHLPGSGSAAVGLLVKQSLALPLDGGGGSGGGGSGGGGDESAAAAKFAAAAAGLASAAQLVAKTMAAAGCARDAVALLCVREPYDGLFVPDDAQQAAPQAAPPPQAHPPPPPSSCLVRALSEVAASRPQLLKHLIVAASVCMLALGPEEEEEGEQEGAAAAAAAAAQEEEADGSPRAAPSRGVHLAALALAVARAVRAAATPGCSAAARCCPHCSAPLHDGADAIAAAAEAAAAEASFAAVIRSRRACLALWLLCARDDQGVRAAVPLALGVLREKVLAIGARRPFQTAPHPWLTTDPPSDPEDAEPAARDDDDDSDSSGEADPDSRYRDDNAAARLAVVRTFVRDRRQARRLACVDHKPSLYFPAFAGDCSLDLLVQDAARYAYFFPEPRLAAGRRLEQALQPLPGNIFAPFLPSWPAGAYSGLLRQAAAAAFPMVFARPSADAAVVALRRPEADEPPPSSIPSLFPSLALDVLGRQEVSESAMSRDVPHWKGTTRFAGRAWDELAPLVSERLGYIAAGEAAAGLAMLPPLLLLPSGAAALAAAAAPWPQQGWFSLSHHAGQCFHTAILLMRAAWRRLDADAAQAMLAGCASPLACALLEPPFDEAPGVARGPPGRAQRNLPAIFGLRAATLAIVLAAASGTPARRAAEPLLIEHLPAIACAIASCGAAAWLSDAGLNRAAMGASVVLHILGAHLAPVAEGAPPLFPAIFCAGQGLSGCGGGGDNGGAAATEADLGPREQEAVATVQAALGAPMAASEADDEDVSLGVAATPPPPPASSSPAPQANTTVLDGLCARIADAGLLMPPSVREMLLDPAVALSPLYPEGKGDGGGGGGGAEQQHEVGGWQRRAATHACKRRPEDDRFVLEALRHPAESDDALRRADDVAQVLLGWKRQHQEEDEDEDEDGGGGGGGSTDEEDDEEEEDDQDGQDAAAPYYLCERAFSELEWLQPGMETWGAGTERIGEAGDGTGEGKSEGEGGGGGVGQQRSSTIALHNYCMSVVPATARLLITYAAAGGTAAALELRRLLSRSGTLPAIAGALVAAQRGYLARSSWEWECFTTARGLTPYKLEPRLAAIESPLPGCVALLSLVERAFSGAAAGASSSADAWITAGGRRRRRRRQDRDEGREVGVHVDDLPGERVLLLAVLRVMGREPDREPRGRHVQGACARVAAVLLARHAAAAAAAAAPDLAALREASRWCARTLVQLRAMSDELLRVKVSRSLSAEALGNDVAEARVAVARALLLLREREAATGQQQQQQPQRSSRLRGLADAAAAMELG
jgi:hypothetical protein